MNPFYFGSSARQLFGAYDPASHSVGGGGVVLCPPFGDEYLFAHDTYRLLAQQLSRANLDVLRFDYFGTGDSAGEFEEADADQWMSDISTAITELKDAAQVARVALVGMRYGGTLAAFAAQQHPDVDRLVLWDAIMDGRAYLAEIGGDDANAGQTVDLLGVGVTPRIRNDVGAITPGSFAGPLPKTLVLSTAAVDIQGRRLAEQLATRGVDVDLDHTPDVPAWGRPGIGRAAMPVNAIRRIVAWLS